MSDLENAEKVILSAGQTAMAKFSGFSGGVCRVEDAVLFDFNRSFIRPDYKPAIEQAFSFGLIRTPSGGAPTQKSDQFLLIAGHTDKVGSSKSNDLLSRRRALATWAVFIIDAEIWENDLYQVEGWGAEELGVMSSNVDPGGSSSLIEHYKKEKSARLDLMRRYLEFLRPDWLPQQSPPLRPNIITSPTPPILGCGFERLRSTAQESRRAEFFYFKTDNPGVKDCSSYRSWQAICGQLITLQIELQNEYGEPLETHFKITLPTGGVLNGKTDSRGAWSRDNQRSGLYTIEVNGLELTELPSGQISKPFYEKILNSTDNEIRLQAIDLNKWFIPKPNPNSSIPQFTRGNTVEPFIDGKSMMASAYNAFTSTSSSQHYIYITNWRMDGNRPLLGASKPDTAVLKVLLDAIGRGVEVRALLWDNVKTLNTPEQQAIDKEDRKPNRGQAILDNDTLNFGSHHQKTTIVKGPEEIVAYCGGMDFAIERWDTPSHKVPDPERIVHNPDSTDPKPWHDVHTKIRGPAAGDIETNFRERWNNHPDRTDNGRTDVADHPAPGPLANGSHLVQVLRTFPPQKKYPFAPGGELGCLNGYLKAIANAHDYIYIEDQYLVFDEISHAIGSVLKGLKGKVIIVIPLISEDFPDAYDYHRYDFIGHLLGIDSTKVEVYYLRNRGAKRNIYVHAKVMIIDDILAMIGSPNINRRSMTHDSEIGITVIDGALENGRRKFARELRKNLWAEHLGFSPNSLDDPLANIDLWHTIESLGGGQIVSYTRKRGSDSLLWNNQIDPDGR